MKPAFEKIFFAMTLVGWAILVVIVLDYNLGWGTTTLRWPDPAHATAAWSWDAAAATPTIIEPASGQWFRVTLPRGFSTATMKVRTARAQSLLLRAEPRDQEQEIVRSSTGRDHTLSFAWAALVARGKTFRFRIENLSSQAATISSLELTAYR